MRRVHRKKPERLEEAETRRLFQLIRGALCASNVVGEGLPMQAFVTFLWPPAPGGYVTMSGTGIPREWMFQPGWRPGAMLDRPNRLPDDFTVTPSWRS